MTVSLKMSDMAFTASAAVAAMAALLAEMEPIVAAAQEAAAAEDSGYRPSLCSILRSLHLLRCSLTAQLRRIWESPSGPTGIATWRQCLLA